MINQIKKKTVYKCKKAYSLMTLSLQIFQEETYKLKYIKVNTNLLQFYANVSRQQSLFLQMVL